MPQSKKARADKNSGRRDPAKTRDAILAVAGKLLGRDGPEGLSVSQVAQLAGVNRGTAYHHFQTREQLLDATMQWVSAKLVNEVFPDYDPDHWVPKNRPRDTNDKLADFMAANPEFGAAWVHSVIINGGFELDPFWRIYHQQHEHFAETDRAQPDIDAEAHAFQTICGVMLMPYWVRGRGVTDRQRKALLERYKKESLRQAQHGMIKR